MPFRTKLDVEWIDGDVWQLTAPLVYVSDRDEWVVVPTATLTDFASIPQALWNVLPPTGPYGPAAVVHDWLYQSRRIEDAKGELVKVASRGDSDRILNNAMSDLGVRRFTRWVVYSGVRIGGWVAWKRHRKEDERTVADQSAPAPDQRAQRPDLVIVPGVADKGDRGDDPTGQGWSVPGRG